MDQESTDRIARALQCDAIRELTLLLQTARAFLCREHCRFNGAVRKMEHTLICGSMYRCLEIYLKCKKCGGPADENVIKHDRECTRCQQDSDQAESD